MPFGLTQQVYAAVTPSDTNVLAPALIAVWVTTAGNLTFRGKGDANTATVAVAVGLTTFPYPVDMVKATGTTAVLGVGAFAG